MSIELLLALRCPKGAPLAAKEVAAVDVANAVTTPKITCRSGWTRIEQGMGSKWRAALPRLCARMGSTT